MSICDDILIGTCTGSRHAQQSIDKHTSVKNMQPQTFVIEEYAFVFNILPDTLSLFMSRCINFAIVMK